MELHHSTVDACADANSGLAGSRGQGSGGPRAASVDYDVGVSDCTPPTQPAVAHMRDCSEFGKEIACGASALDSFSVARHQ